MDEMNDDGGGSMDDLRCGGPWSMDVDCGMFDSSAAVLLQIPY
jgi:hypothetical protein